MFPLVSLLKFLSIDIRKIQRLLELRVFVDVTLRLIKLVSGQSKC